MKRVLAAGVVAAALLTLVVVLRRVAMTVHAPTPPGSYLVVDASADWNGPDSAAPNLARALAVGCVTETRGRATVHRFVWHADGRFRFRVEPSFDEPDRRQLRGCMSDLRMPRLIVSVQATVPMLSTGVPATDD